MDLCGAGRPGLAEDQPQVRRRRRARIAGGPPPLPGVPPIGERARYDWITTIGSAVFAIPPGCGPGGWIGEQVLG